MAQNMRKINLLIVDDHQILIDGIKSLFESVSTIQVVGEAANGKQALEKLNHTEVDIVLMDIEMPVLNGCYTARIIKAKHPNTRVITFTAYSEKTLVTKMRRAGVWGYILKNIGKDELVKVIETVYGGKKCFSKEILNEISGPGPGSRFSKKRLNGTLEQLTRRELEVLEGIAEGLSNSKLGEKLAISARTVDTHRTNLMKKIGVHNIAELVKYAIQNGIVK